MLRIEQIQVWTRSPGVCVIAGSDKKQAQTNLGTRYAHELTEASPWRGKGEGASELHQAPDGHQGPGCGHMSSEGSPTWLLRHRREGGMGMAETDGSGTHLLASHWGWSSGPPLVQNAPPRAALATGGGRRVLTCSVLANSLQPCLPGFSVLGILQAGGGRKTSQRKGWHMETRREKTGHAPRSRNARDEGHTLGTQTVVGRGKNGPRWTQRASMQVVRWELRPLWGTGSASGQKNH